MDHAIWQQSLLVTLDTAYKKSLMVTAQDLEQGAVTVKQSLNRLPKDVRNALMELYDIRL